MSLPPAIPTGAAGPRCGRRGTALEIALQAAGYRAGRLGRWWRVLEALGARHITLPLATESPFGIWRNAATLTRLVREEGVAILHARSRAPAWSAWLAARRTGAHFVTTYHGTYGEGFRASGSTIP